MEPMARPIVAQYGLSGGILVTSVKDLSDGDAKTRSRAGSGPSIAWTIGHLCHYKAQMLQLLGHATANPFAASFAHAAATDGSDYPTLAELLASFSTLNRELSAAVSSASAAQLDGPMPEAGPHSEKKVFDTLLFFAWHEAYHLGGIGAIRKELGRKAISELVQGQ
jgi:uncharacterized damage-inducible protein DinB